MALRKISDIVIFGVGTWRRDKRKINNLFLLGRLASLFREGLSQYASLYMLSAYRYWEMDQQRYRKTSYTSWYFELKLNPIKNRTCLKH